MPMTRKGYQFLYQPGTVDWPFQYFTKQRKLNLRTLAKSHQNLE